MTDEAYREIRLYRQRGLCDCFNNLLTLNQLEVLMDLVRSQIKMRTNLEEVEKWLDRPEKKTL